MVNSWDLVGWLIVVVLAFYGFHLEYKAGKIIKKIGIMVDMFEEGLRPYVYVDKEGEQHFDPVSLIRTSILDTMAHLGATNLTELGYNKAQIKKLGGTIRMAKNGLQVIGTKVGDGLGVNDLVGSLTGGDPEGGPAGGGIDVQSIIMQLFLPKIKEFVGGGGDKGAAPPQRKESW